MAAFYQSAQWKRLRAATLKRDGNRCTTPGCGSTHRLTADHIVLRRKGGADALHNLRTLCGNCHSRITPTQNAAQPRAVGCKPDGTPNDPAHRWARDAD